MMDTRRFHVMKTWNFYHKQSLPSTAGTSVALDDGTTGNDMNTDAYDGPKVMKALQYVPGRSVTGHG